MCPHTTVYVSAYCYICVLILCMIHVSSGAEATRASRLRRPRSLIYTCPHTTICVLILTLILLYVCRSPLYTCPHTTLYTHMCPHTLTHTDTHTTTCVLVAAVYVSSSYSLHSYVSSYSHSYTCAYYCVCLSAAIYGSSRFFLFFSRKQILEHMRYNICVLVRRYLRVLILLHMRPYATVYVKGRICSTIYYCLYLILSYTSTYASLYYYICFITLLHITWTTSTQTERDTPHTHTHRLLAGNLSRSR